MRTTKILKISIITTLFLVVVGFTIYQSQWLQDRKHNIVGIWIEDNDSNYKIEFKNNGKCYKYYTGEPTQEFTYSIGSEFSPSGLEHTYVKLVAVNSDVYEVGESIEFAINSLGDTKMTLELTHPKVSYTHFTKQ